MLDDVYLFVRCISKTGVVISHENCNLEEYKFMDLRDAKSEANDNGQFRRKCHLQVPDEEDWEDENGDFENNASCFYSDPGVYL